MNCVLADTGPLYAAYDPSDTYHEQALTELDRLTNQNLTVMVPYPVLLETHSLILKRLGTRIGLRYINEILSGANLIQPTIEDYQTATQLVQRYPDQAITLFDATTAAIRSTIRPHNLDIRFPL